TIRLLPVNSSAPATTTRIRPSENVNPVSSRATPYGMALPPAPVVVANAAPSAMNAPASTASTNVVTTPAPAFATPTRSAFTAISGGGRASRSPTMVRRIATGARGGIGAAPERATEKPLRDRADYRPVEGETFRRRDRHDGRGSLRMWAALGSGEPPPER